MIIFKKFKFFLIFCAFIVCLFYCISDSTSYISYFIYNKVFVFASDNNDVVNQIDEMTSMLDRWPFRWFKPKIEHFLDSIFTEDVILTIFLILLIFCCSFFWFLNKSFGFFITTVLVWFFYYLKNLWDKTEVGEIFLNLFDKIVIIKPLGWSDKVSILHTVFEKYGLSKDLLLEKDLINIFKLKQFQNISKKDFMISLDEYICLNFSNQIENIQEKNYFSLDEKLKFLFSDFGNSFFKISFNFSYFIWENKFSILFTIGFFIIYNKGLSFYSICQTILNFFDLNTKNNEQILAESSVNITRRTGDALMSLNNKVESLAENSAKTRDALVEFMANTKSFVEHANTSLHYLSDTQLNLAKRVENLEVVVEYACSETLQKYDETVSSSSGTAAIEMVQTVSSNLSNLF